MDYKILHILIAIFATFSSFAQTNGVVLNNETGKPIANVDVFNTTTGNHTTTNENGKFELFAAQNGNTIVLFAEGFEMLQKPLQLTNEPLIFRLNKQSVEIDAVVVHAQEELLSRIRRLKDVENTEVYAAKKNEVVQVDHIIANKASNNARQIYAQVVGLNIYEDCSGGLQLNIGGRGLNPNRSANFNTRQNGYDISADVLGYPESYYTPPAEAIKEIQIVRGAASLQYGSQLGGLVNFKLVEPSVEKFDGKVRFSASSYDTYSGYGQVGGTLDKFSYVAYAQYKNGNCYRGNSDYESVNAYAKAKYNISNRTSVSTEFTHMNSLSKQPGGLTDVQFYEDASFTNRERNWFDVNWNLISNRLDHRFKKNNAKLSVTLNGLMAERNALGFRVNRVSTPDIENANRDLIKGEFKNFSTEARYVQDYTIGSTKATGLIGAKYYQAKNIANQGAGSKGEDADFSFQPDVISELISPSAFEYPNKNIALFTEQIIRLTPKLTAVPGLRYENINTESEGQYTQYNFDLAGNVINENTTADNRTFDRDFLLYGVGLSYKHHSQREIYGNFSTNYRSVTFSDIRITNPSFRIDENITDETGFNADLGYRGNIDDKLTFDVTAFGLQYDNRIGEVTLAENNRVYRYRTNVGKAFTYGLESFAEWNLTNTFEPKNTNLYASVFSNLALMKSEYVKSDQNGVEGNEVEFTPNYNWKAGLRFGYQNLLGSFQFTTMGDQFSDASNAAQDKNDNQFGVKGVIPAYSVADLSLSYKWRALTLETGVNNLFDESYFTRRATGYPGPGIIPSDRRSVYGTLEFRF